MVIKCFRQETCTTGLILNTTYTIKYAFSDHKASLHIGRVAGVDGDGVAGIDVYSSCTAL